MTNDNISRATVYLISALITVIMGLTWCTARDSMELGITNKVQIAVQKTSSMLNTKLLTEVRDDVKVLIRESGHGHQENMG